MRPKYLFIRILEACNADCFMCGFALSTQRYRFTVDDLASLLPVARRSGVRFIRFTGGEPLMHQELTELIAMASQDGMRTSVITNGHLLPRLAAPMAEAGLSQVVVSIDGATADTHDFYRKTPGCFDNAMRGIAAMRDLGVSLRINSVVGPHNYHEVPAMQRLFSRLGVWRWELSALKLGRSVEYADPDDLKRLCDPVYSPADPTLLVPLGKRFYGNDGMEQRQFFDESITPRASLPACHVTDDVIFYDPQRGVGFTCSCLAYTSSGAPINVADPADGAPVRLETSEFRSHRKNHRDNGPLICTGCSATAAGYSDDVERWATYRNGNTESRDLERKPAMTASATHDIDARARRVKRKAGIFVLYGGLSSAQFSRGIFIIFMLSNGLSLTKIGLVESCFQVARLVGEVPFGALADRWQRRGVIQLGLAMHAAAALLFIVGDGLWLYMVIFALLGGSLAAQSGADAALLYDFLVAEGDEGAFAKIMGRASAAGYLSLAIATAAGGVLLDIRHWLPFICECAVILAGTVVLGMFPEVLSSGTATDERLGYWSTIGAAVRMVRSQRLLQIFIVFSALLEAGTTIVSILSQSYLVDRGLNISQTSLILGFVTLLSAGITLFSYHLVKRGPAAALLLSSGFYIAGLLIMLGHTRILAIVGFYLVFLNLDFLMPALRQFLNRLTVAAVRSTTISLQSFVTVLVAAIAFPITTALADRRGYNSLLLLILGGSLPVLLLIAISYRRATARALPDEEVVA